MDAIERRDRVAELRELGFTWREIGERLGVSRRRAEQLSKPPRYVRRGGKISRNEVLIRRLAMAGRHSGDIAAVLGLTSKQVAMFCKSNDIKLVRKPGSGRPRKHLL